MYISIFVCTYNLIPIRALWWPKPLLHLDFLVDVLKYFRIALKRPTFQLNAQANGRRSIHGTQPAHQRLVQLNKNNYRKQSQDWDCGGWAKAISNCNFPHLRSPFIEHINSFSKRKSSRLFLLSSNSFPFAVFVEIFNKILFLCWEKNWPQYWNPFNPVFGKYSHSVLYNIIEGE